MPFLAPELTANQLTVDLALRQPTRIRAQIARIGDSLTVMDKMFHALGAPLQGGGLLYNIVKASDYYVTKDVKQTGPGDEFELVSGVDPESKLALVEKWGGKFFIEDERRSRNDVAYFDNKVIQLSNTIVKKIDTRAMAAIEASPYIANGEQTIPGHSWADVVTVGPETDLTPSAELPSADLSAAQLAADLQQLGIKHDLLLLNPIQAHDLRVAYGDKLSAMLNSAGLEMFSSPFIADGTGWALKRGQAGIVGFEKPLTVEVWDDRSIQSTWVQAFAIPAFGVDKPHALKKLTGLNA